MFPSVGSSPGSRSQREETPLTVPDYYYYYYYDYSCTAPWRKCNATEAEDDDDDVDEVDVGELTRKRNEGRNPTLHGKNQEKCSTEMRFRGSFGKTVA